MLSPLSPIDTLALIEWGDCAGTDIGKEMGNSIQYEKGFPFHEYVTDKLLGYVKNFNEQRIFYLFFQINLYKVTFQIFFLSLFKE